MTEPVPHSLGTSRPARRLPALACDSHMHIFDTRFAASPHWARRPLDAPVAAYRRLQTRLGTTRTVVVTPSTYGTDNRCTLDALAQLGGSARGVAVVRADVPAAELDRLAAVGVVGLRVNFVSPQSWGTTTPAMLQALGDVAAAQGWHLQVFAQPEQLVAMAPVLEALPVPVVIDHMGRIDPATGLADETFALLVQWLARGRAWVKLSGAYMRSACGQEGYRDTLALGRGLVRAAPDRLVWGSDWPHTTEPPDTVDDAVLIDLLQEWCEGDVVRMNRILVHNPARLYGFPPPALAHPTSADIH